MHTDILRTVVFLHIYSQNIHTTLYIFFPLFNIFFIMTLNEERSANVLPMSPPSIYTSPSMENGSVAIPLLARS